MYGEIGVFVSCAHEDQGIAREIADKLRAAGYRIWIDEMEMRAGDSLIARIATGISRWSFSSHS
jgi:hypothetical protein